jgi:hypothetical protein
MPASCSHRIGCRTALLPFGIRRRSAPLAAVAVLLVCSLAQVFIPTSVISTGNHAHVVVGIMSPERWLVHMQDHIVLVAGHYQVPGMPPFQDDGQVLPALNASVRVHSAFALPAIALPSAPSGVQLPHAPGAVMDHVSTLDLSSPGDVPHLPPRS